MEIEIMTRQFLIIGRVMGKQCDRKSAALFLKSFLLAVFVFLCSACSQPVMNSHPEAAFRGIKWGSSLNEVGALQVINNEVHFKTAVRKNEALRLGDADLEKVTYTFIDDRFMKVEIDFTRYSNFSSILAYLIRHYGQPGLSNKDHNIYRWKQGEVIIQLRYYHLSQNRHGHLVYMYQTERKHIGN